MTNQDFIRKYCVSKGTHPQSDYDRKIEVFTYIVPKKDFQYSFKNVLKSIERQYDDTIEKRVHLFSRYRVRIPVYSDYDCTGQLCGIVQESVIIGGEYEWKIIVTIENSYDL